MDSKEAVGDKLKSMIEERRMQIKKVKVSEVPRENIADGPKPIIEALVAFHKLDSLPDSLKSAFKDNELKLGDWIKTSFEEVGVKEIPNEIAKHLAEHQT
jgi:hypothetical protein